MVEWIFTYLACEACRRRCRIKCPSFWKEKKKEEKKSMPSLEVHQPFVVVRYEAGVEGMFSRTVTDNGLFVLK